MAPSPNKLKILVLILLGFVFVAGCGVDENTFTLTISPTTATIGINKTRQFYASAHDLQNNVIIKPITWSVSGDIGTINESGLFSASSSISNGTVTASSGNISASCAVTLTDKGTISGRVRNSSANNVPNLTITFTGPSSLTTSTDNLGNYSVSNASYGTYEVSTNETLLYLPTSAEVFVPTGESASLNMTLSDRLTLTGNPTGDPIIVSGHVTNMGATTAKGVSVTYTFIYTDTDGNSAIAVGSQIVGDISSGSTVPFNVTPAPSISTYLSVTSVAAATSF